MSIWTALFIIAVGIIIFQAMQAKQDGRGTMNQGDPPADKLPDNREAELEDEVQQLRERVKVLEKIATDPARRTAEEIEKLRD